MEIINNPNSTSSSDVRVQEPVDQSYEPHTKQNAKRRRTKKEEGGIDRSHVCACGKSYLSYPALYTHTKQKHGGVAPNNKSDSGNECSMDSSTLLTDLLHLLGEESQRTLISSKDLLDLVSWEMPFAIQNGNVSIFYTRVLSLLENAIEDNHVMSANNAFIWFLREMKESLGFEQLKCFFLFVFIFRRMINDKSTRSLNPGPSDEAETLSARQLPSLANKFMSKYVRSEIDHIQKSVSERNWVFHLVQLQNIRDILKQTMLWFCNWLYQKNLTDDKIRLVSTSPTNT